jgi:hypothetical protein
VSAAVSAQGSAAAKDDSKKPSPLLGLEAAALTVLALGVLGGVLLCLTEVTTVVQITVGGAVRARLSGSDRHGLALLILGAGAVALAWLAITARGGPVLAALGGLGAIGLAALGLWALGDLPDTGRTGSIGIDAATGVAGPGIGFWMELAGALAVLSAATAGLLALRRRRG